MEGEVRGKEEGVVGRKRVEREIGGRWWREKLEGVGGGEKLGRLGED